MATEVKGLKVGMEVVAVTFNVKDIPDGGAFKGYILKHKVCEIVNDTTVVFQLVKNPEKKIPFDFKSDNINCFYLGGSDNDKHYVGIFTDMKLMFEQYKNIYISIKGEDSWPIKPAEENPQKEEKKDEDKK